VTATAFLIPTPGLVVTDPRTMRLLPPEGAQVPLNSYWLRRLQEGSVVERNASHDESSSTSEPVDPATAPEAT
jgi:hypothetical protein